MRSRSTRSGIRRVAPASRSKLKFSPDATNILQFGTFGPDFFGPAFDKVFEHVDEKVRNAGGQVRKAGIFMHFDNLSGYLDANWKYDYLFTRLAYNTAQVIGTWDGTKPPEPRKTQCGARALGAGIAVASLPGLLNEYWVPYFTKNILEKLTDGIGDQVTGKYAFDKAWLAARRVPPANTTAMHLANGLTADAPNVATSTGAATSVTITSPALGSVQVNSSSSSETASQAARAAQQSGQPPLTPDPPAIAAPDWMLAGGGAIVSQRTIHGTIYHCAATGLTATQVKNARLLCRSLR
jgi:hypothetical protein